jgi:hypothetical protein
MIMGLGASVVFTAFLVPFFILQCPGFEVGLIFIMALGIVAGSLSGGPGTIWVLNRVSVAVVLLGVRSGAFMMTTMKYSNIFIPIGVIGVGLGYFLYFRQKKKKCRLCMSNAIKKIEPDNSDICNNTGCSVSCFQRIP